MGQRWGDDQEASLLVLGRVASKPGVAVGKRQEQVMEKHLAGNEDC